MKIFYSFAVENDRNPCCKSSIVKNKRNYETEQLHTPSYRHEGCDFAQGTRSFSRGYSQKRA